MSTAEKPSETRAPRPARGRRLWMFRVAAVVLGLSPLVAFEGLCVVFDWGRPSLHDDPFVGFRSVLPLFVLNEDETRYEIPKARQAFFRPESFAAEKAPGEFRIFCLGGSTVQGRPFAVETAFSTWLEISLRAADPTQAWEAINCGGVSYASYRLVPILEEVLRREPDLIVLYTGHNEFLEDRSFDHIERRGPLVNASLEAAARLRTFTLVREGCLRWRGPAATDPPPGRPVLPTEVEALLDDRGGLERYHYDRAWRQGVVAHFRYNLRRMIEMARVAGVRLILVNPVSNFRDSPPFKSEHRDDLSTAELREWESKIEAAHRHLRRENYDLGKAISLFEQACQINPVHAGGYYSLAKCYELAGRLDEARGAYLLAKDRDVCPLRILRPMNEAVLELARESGTPLVDAQRLFERRSTQRIVGGDWLVDHVHPSIEGHQLLADALAEAVISLGIARPRGDWKQVRRARYREHLDSLDGFYFAKGEQRLRALRNWAQGRMERLRPDEP